MALARLGRLQRAAIALRSGSAKAPQDKRFPVELAGISFLLKDVSAAKRYLERALSIDPADAYANDFLGTVYFLDGNIEAALKYWNRAGKPTLAQVNSDPRPQLDPVLLDRAFLFAPGALLMLRDYRTSEQRIDLLSVFPRYRFQLNPQPDGRFDLTFHNVERNGWGSSKVEALLNVFRRLPFQAVTPEYYNLRRSGANVVTLYRFDAQKRRLFAEFSAPLHRDPKWRYALSTDLRKENWDATAAIAPSAIGGFQSQTFRFETVKAGAALTRLLGPNWLWITGVEFSDRRLSDLNVDPTFARDFLHGGPALKYLSKFSGTPLRIPERRFTISTNLDFSTARLWTTPSSSSFTTFAGGARAQYWPKATGDDYALNAQFRAGKTFGNVPLDELFMLGVERDSDLWLRAHAGTSDGRKGSAPMGRAFILFNSDFEKNIYNAGYLRIKAGPFLDAGRVYDPSPALSAGRWLVDAGVQVKFTVLGTAGVTLSYGRGLRDASSAFYAVPVR